MVGLILLTGATGYVGGRLLSLLQKQGIRVRCVTRRPEALQDRVADLQESGPFAYWYHRHRFLDDGHGETLLRDEAEYAVSMGVIGRWLGGWLVRRKLEVMFAYRHEKTRSLIESGEWPSA